MKKERDVRRVFFWVFLSLMFIVFVSCLVVLVSAAEPATGLGAVFKDVASQVSDLLEKSGLGRKTVSVILLGILLWMILYSVVKVVFGTRRDGFGRRLFPAAISLIITILAFLYLPDNFIDSIVLHYGAMGAAILAIIPFVIMLYFTLMVSENTIVARGAWLFYVLYYLGIYLYKLANSSAVVGVRGFWYTGEFLPYVLAIVFGVVMFFFIAGLRKILLKGKLENIKAAGRAAADRREALLRLEKANLESFEAASGQ